MSLNIAKDVARQRRILLNSLVKKMVTEIADEELWKENQRRKEEDSRKKNEELLERVNKHGSTGAHASLRNESELESDHSNFDPSTRPLQNHFHS